MITKELSNAAVEINAIFKNMSIDLLNKIPQNLQDFFNEIASEDYTFEYNKKIRLSEQKLLPKTQGILALIYRDYLCGEIERANYNKFYSKTLMIKEQEKAKKYSHNNLFSSKTISTNKIVLPIEYKKTSLFRKIFEKFKNIFNK